MQETALIEIVGITALLITAFGGLWASRRAYRRGFQPGVVVRRI